MAKLPRHPRLPLPIPWDGAETWPVPAGAVAWRIYRAGGRHGTTWRTFRVHGPVANGQFDPHPLPRSDSPGFGVLYAALDVPTAIAEAFGDQRFVDRRLDRPYLVGVSVVRELRLLDLASDWPTRAGGSQAISSGPRPTAQNWSRAIHDQLNVDGIAYPSSMKGHGTNVALYERAQDAIASTPSVNMPLDHPALELPLIRVATHLGYGIA